MVKKINFGVLYMFATKIHMCNQYVEYKNIQKFSVFYQNPFKSSRAQMFFKIGALKNSAVFTGKHLCWSLFLLKLQA